MTKNRSANAVDVLLQQPPYGLSPDEKASLLTDAIKEEILFHYQQNDLYKRFCDHRGFAPATFAGDMATLPPVPVQVFKTLGPTLISVDQDKIKVQLESSATSGVPSTVMVDRETAKRQTRAMVKVMKDFLGEDRRPFFIIDVDPATTSTKAIGARGGAVRAYLNFSSSAQYFMTSDDDGALHFDKEAFEQAMANVDPNVPVVLFGFTFVLYSWCVQQLLKRGQRFPLPKGSQVLHIGGWKKLEHQKISKEQFSKDVAIAFGMEPENVIDIYGFTEQMGLNYPDCPQGWKHTPAYSEVVVCDPATWMILPSGKVGVLEFISPVPHSYPGNVLLTDDLGIIDPNDHPCACGRGGTRFRVVGRVKKAETRGCGDIMGQKMFSAVDALSDPFQDNDLQVLYFSGDEYLDLSNEAVAFDDLIASLKRHQTWLREQPIEALIGLINKANQKWQDPGFELQEFRERGLGFLNKWCKPENLRQLADFSLRGRRAYLDGFQSIPGSVLRYIKAKPRGVACHWLSGNVPVLGMLTLVQSIITKNVNLLKAASSYSHAIPLLLSAFKGESYTTPGGHMISGDELLKTIAVVHFSHGNLTLAKKMSSAANVRLAWGGAGAVRHVCSLPKAWNTEDLVFGPKLSFMVIGAGAIDNERSLKRIARRAATDASVFDQTACASPHTIFVERGGIVSPKAFAERLSKEMDKASIRIPKEEVDDATLNAIDTARAVYEFVGNVWGDPGRNWTVLYDEELELAKPTYSRVITVRPVDDIMDVLPFANEDIQTIGLAAIGKHRLDFAEAATNRGVERCPDIGHMTDFESPWDGIIVMERLVRWCTMGGPA